MAKKPPAGLRVAKERSELHRCLVEASVLSTEHAYSRALGRGMTVDLDEPVAPGVKLRDFVRDEWFEVVESSSALETREKNDGTTDRP